MASANIWYPSDRTGSCVLKNSAGIPFEDFACLYPNTYGATVSPIERAFDPVPMRDWMALNLWVPMMAIVMYGVLIKVGQAYFKNKDPWDWRNIMAFWNLGLATFSAIGFARTAPSLFHLLTHYSVQENLCVDPESHFGSGVTGMWVQLFVLSKIPELLDTFFIVIHKKNLIFLHWYHHISVLMYCWYSYVRSSPVGIIFCTMNYAVHALMYFYYFLMAVKMKPKWFNPVWITVAQISQMIVGVAVTVAGWHILLVVKPKSCFMSADTNLAACIMYGSYLLLFLKFFFGRYFVVAKKTSTKTNGTTAPSNGKSTRSKKE